MEEEKKTKKEIREKKEGGKKEKLKKNNILPTKIHIVKAMVFLIVMYGCESRTIRKAEH